MNTPPNTHWLRVAYETMAIRNSELEAMSFDMALSDRKWAPVIRACAAKKRADHYVVTATRRVRLVRRYNPATGQWVTQRVAVGFDESQPGIFQPTGTANK